MRFFSLFLNTTLLRHVVCTCSIYYTILLVLHIGTQYEVVVVVYYTIYVHRFGMKGSRRTMKEAPRPSHTEKRCCYYYQYVYKGMREKSLPISYPKANQTTLVLLHTPTTLVFILYSTCISGLAAFFFWPWSLLSLWLMQSKVGIIAD